MFVDVVRIIRSESSKFQAIAKVRLGQLNDNAITLAPGSTTIQLLDLVRLDCDISSSSFIISSKLHFFAAFQDANLKFVMLLLILGTEAVKIVDGITQTLFNGF